MASAPAAGRPNIITLSCEYAAYGGASRAPNVICGVGFIAQASMSRPITARPDAANPRRNSSQGRQDEIIGQFRLIGGGAAGIELDCIATNLGSLPTLLRLASSGIHSMMMLP